MHGPMRRLGRLGLYERPGRLVDGALQPGLRLREGGGSLCGSAPLISTCFELNGRPGPLLLIAADHVRAAQGKFLGAHRLHASGLRRFVMRSRVVCAA